MIEKLNYTYNDVKDDIITVYRSHKETLNQANIETSNDYMTDEFLGQKAFENELDEFFNVLAMCVSMVELRLYDKYFFDEIQEMIGKYKNGYFDDYLADDENKADIDTDITKVEQYIKLQ